MSTARSNSDQYDLVAWLRNQLDIDERDIEESRALSGDLHWSMPDWLHRDRMLAEMEAKRRIIERAERALQHEAMTASDPVARLEKSLAKVTAPELERVLRLLALPYADRAGYDEGWRP